jgi:DNA-binding transcriptional ArsR family regulator
VQATPVRRTAIPDTLQDFKAELFRTLASGVRIRILEALRSRGTMTVGDLQQLLGLDPSNVSQHLAILRARSIVVGRREGNNVRYSIAEPAIPQLLDAAREIFQHQVDAGTRLLGA